MKLLDKVLTGGLALGLLGAAGLQGAARHSRGAPPAAGAEAARPEAGDVWIGPPPAGGAPVLVAFTSLTCAHCAAWERGDLPGIERRLVASGRLRVALRDFPLDPAAAAGAALLRCLPEGARRAARADLSREAASWSRAPRGAAAAAAQAAGLRGRDADDAAACALDPATRREVSEAARRAHEAHGIRATPSFVLVGGGGETRAFVGRLRAEDLEAMLPAAGAPAGGATQQGGTRP